LLQTIAVRAGANAIVNLELEKYTKSDACSNYRYTMHRYSGDAVIVKRPSYTTDPQVIAQSEAQMRTLAMIEAQPPLALTRMDKPPVWQFVPLLTWYWVCTVLRLGGTTCLVLVRLLLARPRRT